MVATAPTEKKEAFCGDGPTTPLYDDIEEALVGLLKISFRSKSKQTCVEEKK